MRAGRSRMPGTGDGAIAGRNPDAAAWCVQLTQSGDAIMAFQYLAASVAGALLLHGAAATASEPRTTTWFDARQDRQEARIARGVEAGRIGEREAAALGNQQARIADAYDRRLADGRLGARDAWALDRRLERGSAGIRMANRRPR